MDTSAAAPIASRQPPYGERGFTLIELIVTLVILVVVLGMAYQILQNCLQTEAWIERAGLPEKIGVGIMTQFRKDLQGTVYRNLGTDRVFVVTDGGSGDSARDELHFYTSQEPSPFEDPEGRGALDEEASLRGLTVVSYYLKENSQGLSTLFRRENIPGEGDPFESAGGISREIYNKVVSLNIYCFDSVNEEAGVVPWVETWDSREKLMLEAAEAEAAAAESAGIPRVGASAVSDPGSVATDPAASATPEEEEATLPPAAVPKAVRVEVTILVGDERGVYRDRDGNPLPPKVYTAVVPLLVAERIPIAPAEETDLTGEDASGVGGTDKTSPTGTGGGPGGTGTPKSVTRGSSGGR